jgi:hypothetical protein
MTEFCDMLTVSAVMFIGCVPGRVFHHCALSARQRVTANRALPRSPWAANPMPPGNCTARWKSPQRLAITATTKPSDAISANAARILKKIRPMPTPLDAAVGV